MKPKVYIHSPRPISVWNKINLPDFNFFRVWWAVLENGQLVKRNKTEDFKRYILTKSPSGDFVLRKFASLPVPNWKILYDGPISSQEYFLSILKAVGFPTNLLN
jgi:hypothetical protein